MDVRILKKPPLFNTKSERLKVTLLGDHAIDDKACMFLQAVAFLTEQGFTNAGLIDMYIPLQDADRHPLSHFRDGTPIAGHYITIEGPYSCAADHYDRKYTQPARPSITL